jgi:hypothetical protein
MSRGIFSLVVIAMLFVGGSHVLAQARPPVIAEKAAIGQPSGLFDVSASGTFTLVNPEATKLECRVEVKWRKQDGTFVPDAAHGTGRAVIAGRAKGEFAGTKPGSNPPDNTAVPMVRVSIWGSAKPGAAVTRLTPFTDWQTMPRQ